MAMGLSPLEFVNQENFTMSKIQDGSSCHLENRKEITICQTVGPVSAEFCMPMHNGPP